MGIELLTDEEKNTLNQAFKAGQLSPEEIQGLERQGFQFTDQGTPLVTTPFFKASLKSPQRRREFGEAIAEEAPVVGGATVGGILGGIPGAIFGGIAGEAGKQLGQRADVLPGEAPETSTGVIGEMLMSGTQAGAGEAGGQLAFKGLQKIAGPFAKRVTPEGREAIEAMEGTGFSIPPAKVTDSSILDIAQNAAEASFGGGEQLLQNRLGIGRFADDVIETTVEAVRNVGGREELGSMVQSAIQENSVAFRGAAAGMYKQVDDIVGGESVFFTDVKKSAQDRLSEIAAGLKNPTAQRLIRDILGKGDAVSFREAQILRSDLLGVTRQSSDVVPGKVQGVAKELVKNIDDAMEQSAARLGEDALDAWRNANSFWKEGKEIFNNRLINRIANSEPDAVAKTIFNSTKARPVTVRKIMKAIDDPEAKEAVRGEVLNDIVFSAKDPETGELNGRRLVKLLKDFGGSDDAALKELFPKGEAETIRKWANVKNVVVRGQPDARGRLVVEFGQASALSSLVFGFDTGAVSLPILLGPPALARMMTNKTIAKWLTTGVPLGSKAKAGTKTFGQFLSLLTRENIEFELPDSPRSPFSSLGKVARGQATEQEEETQTTATPFDALSKAFSGQ